MLGLVVKHPFFYQRSMVVAAERRGAVTPATGLKATSAKRAGDPPAEKLASKNDVRPVDNSETAAA